MSRRATASKALAALIVAAGCLAAAAYAATTQSPPAGGGARSGDPRPPRPRIVKHPMKDSLSSVVAFGFSSRVPQAGFQCRLDAAAWKRCGARVRYRGIAPGDHAFLVRVESRAGARSRPARFDWVRPEPKGFAIEPDLSALGKLYPGAPAVSLPLQLKNPNPAPIRVTALKVSVSADPPGCPSASNLELIQSSASPANPVRIPAGGVVGLPAAGISAPALALRDLPVNQDACQGARFALAFSGEARGVRRLLFTKFTGPVVASVLVAAISASALAYFSAEGTGSASAAVSKLTAPTIATANAAAGGTVALSWSAATAPEAEAVRYYVTRDGGDPGGTCGVPAAPTAAISCTDSGLSIGTHSYTVTAVWRSWSATSGTKTANVTIGPATHFTIAAATTTPAVSAADNLTIVAKDEKEATVTTYAGSHPLIFSGASSSPSGTAPTVANSSGTAIAFGSATALTFTAGVASVTSSKNGLMKLYRAGAASIAASEGTLNTPAPLAVTVTPGTATKYALAAATTTPAVGATDDLTITAQDTYGNTATAYVGSHNLVFSGASASPGGTLPTVTDAAGAEVPFGSATALDFSAGVASANGAVNGEMTLYKSGATSVTATEGTVKNTTALALTVAAGAANKLILAASSTTPVAAATVNLTTTARDAYENTATAYAGSKSIVFSGASASPSGAAPTVVNSAGTAIAFGAATALTFTAGVAAVSSSKNGLLKLNKAGAASVTASDGTFTTAPVGFTVAAGTASKLALTGVTASAGAVSATCLFTCPVTGLGNSGTIAAFVSVTDSVGNTVSGVGSGHTVKVTATTGGTIAGTPLTIAETGPAVSTTQFTYTAPASGSFTHTITAATLAGTVYTSATATASK